MRKLITLLLMLCAAPTLAGCLTSKRLEGSGQTAICLALSRSDVLPTLDEEEKALLLEHFSRETLDAIKTPRAVMREIGC